MAHISGIMRYVSCDWLTSLGIMFSRLIHAVTNDRISFLKDSVYTCVYICVYIYDTYHFFVHSSVEKHLICFHIMTIVYNAEGRGDTDIF